MSEMDDYFDMRDYLKKSKAPKHILDAWNRHVKYLGEVELDLEAANEVVRAVNVLKMYFKK